MTDLIESTLHRLHGELSGRLSRPGDERYASRNGDLGEAGRPDAARGRALPHGARRAVGDPSCARQRSFAFGTWRRSRLGRSRVVRRHRDRPDRDERCNAEPRQPLRTDFGRRPRLGRFRGDRSARARGSDGLVQLRRHDRADARWRLRIADRPLRTRARQSARRRGRARGWAHRHREPQQRTGIVLGVAWRWWQFWRGDRDAAPDALFAQRPLRHAAIPIRRSQGRSRRMRRHHGCCARRADGSARAGWRSGRRSTGHGCADVVRSARARGGAPGAVPWARNARHQHLGHDGLWRLARNIRSVS